MGAARFRENDNRAPLADQVDLEFEPLSAVFSGVADLRKVFEKAAQLRAGGRGTLLFVDEIHRFNRAQQDGFLPVCRRRHGRFGRRDNRESQLRAKRSATITLSGTGARTIGRRSFGDAAFPIGGYCRPPIAARRRRAYGCAGDGRWGRAVPPESL